MSDYRRDGLFSLTPHHSSIHVFIGIEDVVMLFQIRSRLKQLSFGSTRSDNLNNPNIQLYMT